MARRNRICAFYGGESKSAKSHETKSLESHEARSPGLHACARKARSLGFRAERQPRRPNGFHRDIPAAFRRVGRAISRFRDFRAPEGLLSNFWAEARSAGFSETRSAGFRQAIMKTGPPRLGKNENDNLSYLGRNSSQKAPYEFLEASRGFPEA